MSNKAFRDGWDRVFGKSNGFWGGAAEFVGKIPVRQDIEILPADKPNQLKLGWVVSETIGQAVINPFAVNPYETWKERIQQMIDYQLPEEEIRTYLLEQMTRRAYAVETLRKVVEENFPKYISVLNSNVMK